MDGSQSAVIVFCSDPDRQIWADCNKLGVVENRADRMSLIDTNAKEDTNETDLQCFVLRVFSSEDPGAIF